MSDSTAGNNMNSTSPTVGDGDFHPYNKPQTVNQTVGEPLNAPNPFAPGQNIAITLMTKQTDRPIFSGSLPFAGTTLAFHTTTGEPFIVTYTLDAVAKSPTTTSK
jgi:hypothetical protein